MPGRPTRSPPRPTAIPGRRTRIGPTATTATTATTTAAVTAKSGRRSDPRPNVARGGSRAPRRAARGMVTIERAPPRLVRPLSPGRDRALAGAGSRRAAGRRRAAEHARDHLHPAERILDLE